MNSAKNFLDIDHQIIENEKFLAFYYNNYQKTQSKFSNLLLVYSVQGVYLLQLVKFPIDNYHSFPYWVTIIFIVALLANLCFLIYSMYFSYMLLKPVDVAYLYTPKFHYDDLAKRYKEKLKDVTDSVLNKYIKASYLKELEKAVGHNSQIFKQKSGQYYNAFRFGIFSLLIYMFCTGFVIFQPDLQDNGMNISNYKEIIKYLDKNFTK